MENSLNFLGKREGFNVALRHFKGVTAIIKQFESKTNLADILNQRLEEKKFEAYQVSPIISALLVDKYKYFTHSFNMKNSHSSSLSKISNVVDAWSAFDITIIYHHPQLGVILINPKNAESWTSIDSLRENELVVFYIGSFKQEFNLQLAEKCGSELKKLLNGEITSSTMKFTLETLLPKEAKKDNKPEVKKTATQSQPVAPKPATSGGKKKMSPQYGITVTNELFHNGNVEAWKRIIRSYENKYPEIKVLVFYDGEQIHDFNTLFKWGKVKHGTNIYISLLGFEFLDISKLRRYLSQGASSRFEDFLKGDPTKDMVLF